MPDRAKVSKGFPRCYQTYWEKIKNDQPISSIAESGVDAVESDIKTNELGIDQFINTISERLRVFEDRSFMHQIVRWDNEHDALHNIRRQSLGNEIALECGERAARTLLIDLENGRTFNDMKTELHVRFKKEIYEARFSLPTEASDEQKLRRNDYRDSIVNLLRESQVGRKIEDPEAGDLTTWKFG